MRSRVQNVPSKDSGKLKDFSRGNNPYISAIKAIEEVFGSVDSLQNLLIQLHKNDDVDSDQGAHHHSLGFRGNQALMGSFGPYALRVGEVKFYAGNPPVGGFLECDGSSVSAADYPHLAQALGESGTFNLPTITVTGCTAYICYNNIPVSEST